MARRCTVCDHPKRVSIEKALVGLDSLRDTAIRILHSGTAEIPQFPTGTDLDAIESSASISVKNHRCRPVLTGGRNGKC